ncbi:MAG: FAD-dependent oxidoreductase [Pseudomonadota bacterium]
MRRLTRRQFLIGSAGVAALAAVGQWVALAGSAVAGRIVGASSARGHRLREGKFPPPAETIRKKIVIVGGGIAGLSAAWKLQKSGVTDFLLLELEDEVGGNASSGSNATSAYPWGAHYVPLLTEESTCARELFRELGIITGEENGQPIYNEYYLRADPEERLFMHGRWQDGIVPQIGISDTDRAQYNDFFARMEQLRGARGRDGRKLFAIPLDKSSADPTWRALDRITMADYLQQNGWDSPHLRWYVDYCCRDDYGAVAADVSAWAGIHYFAGRSGKAANTDGQSVVTWPEGNGWIVNQLKAKLAGHLQPKCLAFHVEKTPKGATVDYMDIARDVAVRVEAEAVIIATPRFIAERLLPTKRDLSTFHYSPWMVANITLNRLPAGKGAPLSWDNMVYNSPLLGYVVATHQNLNRVQTGTVLTYYWPLSHLPPKQAREQAYARSYEQWRDLVLTELLRIHPELRGHVAQLDVWLWGHGMIRPSPGFVWGAQRAAALATKPPVFYAHSDMSGISIFEEANHHGVKAAESLMRHFNHPFRSSL